jgi:hypothetical protein
MIGLTGWIGVGKKVIIMNKWRNVKYNVPKLKTNQHCKEVLVCTWDKGLEDQDEYKGDVQTALYFKEKGFKTWLLKPENPLDDWKETYKGTFRYDYLPDKVTHWMYLPNPPAVLSKRKK